MTGRAGVAAVAAGAQTLVLDDGHQNPALKKTVGLIVVDGETRDDEWPFGDGAVFPAGPMREPLGAGLARADAVVIMLPTDVDTADPELLALFGGLPVFAARLTPEAPAPPGPQVGFAGIAKPWKVERSLIVDALKRNSGNVTLAARALGISRDTLRYRMEKYSIRRTVGCVL